VRFGKSLFASCERSPPAQSLSAAAVSRLRAVMRINSLACSPCPQIKPCAACDVEAHHTKRVSAIGKESLFVNIAADTETWATAELRCIHPVQMKLVADIPELLHIGVLAYSVGAWFGLLSVFSKFRPPMRLRPVQQGSAASLLGMTAHDETLGP
jgi:hypothetical protein